MMRTLVPICVLLVAGWYLFTGGCTDLSLHIPRVDGFMLNESTGRSDADLATVLAEHDHDARVVGPLKRLVAPDGIVYTFAPDENSADVERTLGTLYPAPIPNELANGLPVTVMLRRSGIISR